ncbi:hypothetical protein IM40_05865 [Candidatus Paracaedimonas acanthamoebae]|nr:hypothetical protein IM40_05865 [Candidatus Paracaedimonas acanthamoebae]
MSILSKCVVLSCSYFALLNSQVNASALVEEATSNYNLSHSQQHYSQEESAEELELAASNLQTALTTSLLKNILMKNGKTTISIDISENTLGDEALEVIAAYPHFQHLYLQENCFTDEGAPYLKVFVNAKEVNLSRNYLTSKGLKHLPLNRLEILQVDSMELGNESLKIISKAPSLKHLNIRNAQLDDNSASDLLKMQTVEILGLSYNSFTDDSLSIFTQMKNLKALDLSYNKFTQEGIEQLRIQLPGTMILFKTR